MKKLLLILLCLPIIGFGQNDKIIFSSGDTIIGKVIEVGVNNITYQHKDETTNNVTKKRELAKVIYSSGRTETFGGLSILKSKIAKEESEKLYIQQKEEQKKIKIQKNEERKLTQRNYKKSLELGMFFGASFNNNISDYDKKQHTTFIQGLILKYNYNPNFSFHTELNYHILGWNEPIYGGISVAHQDDPFMQNNSYRKYSNHYLSLPVNIEYNFSYKINFNIKTGFYTAYLIKSDLYFMDDEKIIQEVEMDLESDFISRFDFGGILGVGLSYPINDRMSIFFDYTAYYGMINWFTDINGNELNNNSKNRMYRAVLGLTYNLKNK
jgi:hypothetical protein